MNFPLAFAATTAFISSSAAAANKLGKLESINDHKNKVRALALGSIALTAGLYAGATVASTKALGSKAVTLIRANPLKSGAGLLGGLAVTYFAYNYFNRPTTA